MVTKSHQTPRDQASKEGGVMVSLNVEYDWGEYIGSDTNQRKNLIGLICSPREIYIRKKSIFSKSYERMKRQQGKHWKMRNECL